MSAARTLSPGTLCASLLALLCLWVPGRVSGQDLADLDYDNLSFRGFGFDWGYLWPTRIDRTGSVGLRFDMGYAGPGLRIMPHVTYWSAPFRQEEIAEFEERIAQLVSDQTGEPPVALDLGTIEWRDIAIGVDAHVVWDSLFDLLTYGGFGVTAHILNGDGDVIGGTFIDDLLDSVSAGVNLHFGAEYPVSSRFRVYSLAKYEVMSDMQFFTARVGWQIMTGPNAPGEER